MKLRKVLKGFRVYVLLVVLLNFLTMQRRSPENQTKKFRVVPHIPKFGNASKSPSGDTASPVADAASLLEMRLFPIGDVSSPLEMHIPRTHIPISRLRDM